MTIVVSIGLNPLPVLVAVRRLALKHPEARFVFLYSREDEFLAITNTLNDLRAISQYISSLRLLDPKSPTEIISKLVTHFREHPDEHIHFHYTGGTKVMVLHAIRALVATKAALTTSYMGAEEHFLIGTDDLSANTEDLNLGEPDERKSFAIEFEALARLHGHTTLYRVVHPRTSYRVVTQNIRRSDRIIPNPAPIQDDSWIKVASHLAAEIPNLTRPDYAAWNAFLDQIRAIWRPKRYDWTLLPDPRVAPQPRIIWPLTAGECADIPAGLNTALGTDAWDADGYLHANQLDGRGLESLVTFLLGGWMEHYTYSSLRTALSARGLPFRLAMSIRFARLEYADAERRNQKAVQKDFELDVAALLGYQLLVVSCYAGGDVKQSKQKAFEAVHRARQIGGGEALALLASATNRFEAEEIERELDAQARTFGPPVTVICHRENLCDLPNLFGRYLDGLDWR